MQVRTFQWFWDLANTRNGLIPDRAPSPSFSSIAAVGFALTGYPVGVERGWISRAEARERTLTTLRFFWTAPQSDAASGASGYKGFFYHFLDMQSGTRFERVELSTIDTALLLAGVLTCQVYFDGSEAEEVAIRAYADSIYRRVDWRWAQPHPPKVSHGWHPERGFILDYDWSGYDEAMLLYILALGSPTHPIDPAAWPAWTSTYNWAAFQGREFVQFAPLFGHQYSQIWIDYRGIRDEYMRGRGIDYFENSRRATLAQRAYAIANPGGFAGYGADLWGLTASDGPIDTVITLNGVSRKFQSYTARGAGADYVLDDGTIAPTAAGGSVPFAPEVAIPALQAMRRAYGGQLFGRYGFVDAFNPTYRLGFARFGRVDPAYGWIDVDQLGIDQGPILTMIENHRTGLVWSLMRRNPYIIQGLRRAGFSGGWLDQAQR